MALNWSVFFLVVALIKALLFAVLPHVALLRPIKRCSLRVCVCVCVWGGGGLGIYVCVFTF